MPKYGMPQTIELEKIDPSPFQVRIRYGKIDELAENIRKHGLLQPILVRPTKDRFEIVHGHRRYNAVKKLGWKYIQSFVKELDNVESIIIQGSENLKRKDYDPIEEGTLYRNFKDYMKKERNVSVGYEEIGKEFDSSRQNVQDKIGLLDLPNEVQQKIIEGIIPVGKALALIPLTREIDADVSASKKAGFDFKQRTNEYFEEIQVLASEIEKGSEGGIRTKKAISQAIDLIQSGIEIGDALDKAKLSESIDRAKKQAEKGEPPEKIISDILSSQQDPQKVLSATIELNISQIRQMLDKGTLKCPYCGGNHLEWACVHERV